MVNFWLNIMLHNCLAFKLRNGFLLPLTTLLFQNKRGGGGGEMMGQEKGEAEETNIKNERRESEKKKRLDVLILPKTQISW